jgi:hypothetical protein
MEYALSEANYMQTESAIFSYWNEPFGLRTRSEGLDISSADAHMSDRVT